ncbi:hypothetical protein N7495_008253 [Penicillium taxi]|uniref:uncharacterized protein n=1 Tax=Penicillium taxi TaxID=168475 RepID=UPI00254558B0|nr:uncharacterized protein N7495_008253 [Penicillium taxi]KAJ5888212.1 hypothetical protein N7495_008253 [Penicillium taxi]
MSSKWSRLYLKQEDLPLLLFQYTWSRQGYELYVTDLTSVWSERLPQKEILKRAENNNTTIDPSESQEQLEVLLVKIGEALRGDGGSSTVSHGSDANSLELSISTKLPAPLKALKWTLSILKEPASSLTTQLLLPLLRDEAAWESRQRSILDQLKQKDWVLGRIFDKIDVLGIDLATIFPGAAGLRTSRKGNTRSEAAKYIKGLAPFDESAWLTESERLAANLVHELVGSDCSAEVETISPPPDRWWSSVSAAVEEDNNTRDSQNSYKLSQRDLDMDLDQNNAFTESEDEFEEQENLPQRKAKKDQVISSPPKSTKKKSPPQTRAPDPGESELESEPLLSQRRTPSISPPPKSPSKQAPKKLKTGFGVIGGKRKQEKQPTPSPPPPPSPQNPEKAEVVEDTPQNKPAPKKPKLGLGVIGGKKKQEKQSTLSQPPPQKPEEVPKAAEDTSTSTSQTQPMVKPKRPAKLGMIGGKVKAKVSSPRQETPAAQPENTPAQYIVKKKESSSYPPLKREDSPQPSPSAGKPDANPPAAPETDEQKVQRKREELKRKLDAKTKAPKKRRF